ncbi:4Fe-4S dicluster domain-containing protein [Ruminococcaceae bacterium FB2012]|nr:4Fe-4S dicluster domain-containing protein [Ruminococcaceae bacterium FB2012]
MVLYFSASGNTRYIAQLIARRLGDDCIDLGGRIRAGDYAPIRSEKPFVVCAPVYICEMPRFVRDYLKRLPMRGNRQVYFVFTSGGYAGMSGSLAARLVKRKKLIYRGHAEVKMPGNHIVSDAYPQPSPEECLRRIESATKQARQIAAVIRRRGTLKARHVFLAEKLIILPFNSLWSRYGQPSKPFYTTDKCVGCGKCSRLCPLGNIEMKDRRPVWKGPCAHCMACILNCPFEAIEYGNITQKKEKYNISHYVRAEK